MQLEKFMWFILSARSRHIQLSVSTFDDDVRSVKWTHPNLCILASPMLLKCIFVKVYSRPAATVRKSIQCACGPENI